MRAEYELQLEAQNMNIKHIIVEHILLDAIKNYCEAHTNEKVSTACLESCPFYELYGFCKLWECRIIIQRHHEQTLNSKEENEEVN